MCGETDLFSKRLCSSCALCLLLTTMDVERQIDTPVLAFSSSFSSGSLGLDVAIDLAVSCYLADYIVPCMIFSF